MKLGRLRAATLVVAASTIITVAWAAPAFADVQKTGSTSCPAGDFVQLTAKYSGFGSVYWPSTVIQDSSNHSTNIISESWFTGKRSTTWKVVESGGLLDDDGTFGSCVPNEFRS